LQIGVLVPQAGPGQAEFESEFGKIATAHVAELDRLEVLPNSFLRIEFRRVGGQRIEARLVYPDVGACLCLGFA
jgi:hypothetical protein